MTALHVRAISRRAGALLGAVAVLTAGCAAAGGSGPRAGRAGTAQDAVAARASSHRAAHRTARTTEPGSVRRSNGTAITGPLPLFQCEHPMSHPAVTPASAASRPRLVMPVCPCCGWCSCAWACCGCGPGPWPPGGRSRPHLAWLCCTRWHWPPSESAALIPPACEPGCRSFVCPAGARGLVPGAAALRGRLSRARAG